MKKSWKDRGRRALRNIGVMVVLCLVLAACGGSGNTLLEGASVKNSALALYHYDGKDTIRGHIFDAGQRQEIIDTLSAAKVSPMPNWSPADIQAPIYGITYMDEYGFFHSALWSEGMWITEEGEAYRLSCDVVKLYGSYEWQSVDTWSDRSVLPALHALTNVDGAWDPTWMNPAQEPVALEGKTIELVEWTETDVKVKLVNHSGQEWVFGEYYHLEVQVDGAWYYVPTAPGRMNVVHDLAHVLPDGGEKEMTYSLWCYGDLPDGHYRLVAEAFEEGLAVEADVKTSQGQ